MNKEYGKINHDISEKMSILKMGFSKIKEVRSDTVSLLESLDMNVIKLKNIYSDFVKTNKEQMFLFGLDTFNFQTKYMEIEIKDCKRFQDLLLNRLYCDYYRLFKLMKENCEKLFEKDKEYLPVSKREYPKYNFLNIYQPYSFSDISSLFDEVMGLLNNLFDFYTMKEEMLRNHNQRRDNGLNIHNFIFAYKYENNHLLDTIYLYINYLEFFLSLHSKYFMRFITRIKIIYGQITHDINFDKPRFSKDISYEETNVYDTIKDEYNKKLFTLGGCVRNSRKNKGFHEDENGVENDVENGVENDVEDENENNRSIGFKDMNGVGIYSHKEGLFNDEETQQIHTILRRENRDGDGLMYQYQQESLLTSVAIHNVLRNISANTSSKESSIQSHTPSTHGENDSDTNTNNIHDDETNTNKNDYVKGVLYTIDPYADFTDIQSVDCVVQPPSFSKQILENDYQEVNRDEVGEKEHQNVSNEEDAIPVIVENVVQETIESVIDTITTNQTQETETGSGSGPGSGPEPYQINNIENDTT
jgi:hypothetical protein